MKILVVEDDRIKRQLLEYLLKENGIDMHLSKSIRPAIRHVLRNSEEIDGIILDLGLTSYDNSTDYDFGKGLELIKELSKNGIQIPILINSSTYVNLPNLMKDYSNIKGQMYSEDDFVTVRWFINLLKGEEQ